MIVCANVHKSIAELVLDNSLINPIANANALVTLHAHQIKLETHSLVNAVVQLLNALKAKL